MLCLDQAFPSKRQQSDFLPKSLDEFDSVSFRNQSSFHLGFCWNNINKSSSNTQRDYQLFVNQRSIYQMSDDFLFKNFHRSFSILSNIWKFKTLVNLCVLYIVHCNVHTLRFLGNLRGFTLSESQRQHLSHFCWNFWNLQAYFDWLETVPTVIKRLLVFYEIFPSKCYYFTFIPGEINGNESNQQQI